MKVKLDFDAKTIELETPISMKEIDRLQDSLTDYEEWTIIAPIITVSVPSVWYPDWTWRPGQVWYGTYTDTAGEHRAPVIQ